MAALVRVTSVEGSTPRIAGTKMLIKSDGSIVGFAGGGSMESRICREATEVMRKGKPRMVRIDLTGKTLAEEGMICGGKIEIFVEPIIGGENLYIFGAGHIFFFISKIGKMLGFRIVVIDDRKESANSERFAQADDVIVADFDDVFTRIHVHSMSYIVIVTRGHLHDEKVLERAIQTDARYIGMIGSKKKIQTIYSHLEERGTDPKLLKFVHAPIGLGIRAQTPEEIAVRILAEIIMVRQEKQS